MNKVCLAGAALALLCLAGMAQANITIDTVTVGDAGNAADTAAHSGNPAGQGSVAYTYNIGKYEVTTAQYTSFLNAVAKSDPYSLYNIWMDTVVYRYGCNIKRTGTSGNYVYTVGTGSSTDITNWGNRPVNYVSYWDSCRFANWLGNGQGTGSTETGAYTLDGYTGADGRTIVRNAGCTWAVTSEDEWYKAAYYKSGGTNAGYWLYPTQSNTAPANQVLATDPGNSANYRIEESFGSGYTIDDPCNRTNVGEFENSGSAYGTFDQGGNVWEWNQAIVGAGSNYACRGVRGGSYDYSCNVYTWGDLQASGRYDHLVSLDELKDLGFRVSQFPPAAIPEPASLIAAIGILGPAGLMFRRRRV